MTRILMVLILCSVVLAALSCGKPQTPAAAKKVKIGFIIPLAENEWYQLEWKFAEDAAKKYDFELVKLLAIDGDKVLAAMDNLGAQGAAGVIICSVDVKLGPAIVAAAKRHNMKLMSVDDRLVDDKGQFLADVHHVGIQARKIGELVGQSLANEMKTRGWKAEETAAMGVAIEQVDTARQRTDGTRAILIKNGFPAERIIMVAWPPQFTRESAFNAANDTLTAHNEVKNWLVFGPNDDAVIGPVQAIRGKRYEAKNIIGIGIDGTVGVDELKRAEPTGFFGSILLQPKLHGYGTAESMYKWIAQGEEPEKEHFTDGILIRRDNYAEEMRKQGLNPDR